MCSPMLLHTAGRYVNIELCYVSSDRYSVLRFICEYCTDPAMSIAYYFKSTTSIGCSHDSTKWCLEFFPKLHMNYSNIIPVRAKIVIDGTVLEPVSYTHLVIK